MKTRIIQIGRSQGVRISKRLLEQTGLHDEVEITTDDGALIIRQSKKPRDGWAAAFQQMALRGDDALVDDTVHVPSSRDEEKWEWR